MKNKLLCILLVLIYMHSLNIYSQNTDFNMQKFDIQKFLENREIQGGNVYSYSLNDSTKVTEQYSGNSFLSSVRVNDANRISVYEYDMQGYLMKSWEEYCSELVGIFKYYDKDGRIIKEDNMDDNGFKLSMDDLRTELKEITGIDMLYHPLKLIIWRQTLDKPSPYLDPNAIHIYDITMMISQKTMHGEYYNIQIDGDTGKIISHTNEHLEDLTKDSEYRKKNERFLNPGKRNKSEERNWSPLFD